MLLLHRLSLFLFSSISFHFCIDQPNLQITQASALKVSASITSSQEGVNVKSEDGKAVSELSAANTHDRLVDG
jgi:hypothetical protein